VAERDLFIVPLIVGKVGHLAGGDIEPGKREKLAPTVAEQIAAAAVRRPLRRQMMRRTARRLGREPLGRPAVEVEQEERVARVAFDAAEEQPATIGRVVEGPIGAVVLVDQPWWRAIKRLFVEVEIAWIAPVGGVAQAVAVGRPRAKGVNDVGLIGQRREGNAVIAHEVELRPLGAAGIPRHQEHRRGRRVGGAVGALAAKGDLMRPGRRLRRRRNRDGPDLGDAGDVRDEAESPAVRREVGVARGAYVEVALEGVAVGAHHSLRFHSSHTCVYRV